MRASAKHHRDSRCRVAAGSTSIFGSTARPTSPRRRPAARPLHSPPSAPHLSQCGFGLPEPKLMQIASKGEWLTKFVGIRHQTQADQGYPMPFQSLLDHEPGLGCILSYHHLEGDTTRFRPESTAAWEGHRLNLLQRPYYVGRIGPAVAVANRQVEFAEQVAGGRQVPVPAVQRFGNGTNHVLRVVAQEQRGLPEG